jgi:hypothetical protein
LSRSNTHKTITPPKTAKKIDPLPASNKPVDVWSRVLSVIAVLISLFTFALQFAAHDEVSYSIPQTTNATWATNTYFAISLNVFNTGNRPAALVSATARLVEKKFGGDQRQITDAACFSETGNVKSRGLYAGNPDEHVGPNVGAVYKYETSIEPGKLSTTNLLFRVFAKSDKSEIPKGDQDIEGIVCLDLIFVASKGSTYIASRAIYGVHLQFDEGKSHAIEAPDLAGNRKLVPVTVIDTRRVELPF